MMHIANIIEEGRLGGPQVRMVRVAAALADKGCKTTIIMPRRDSEGFRDACRRADVDFVVLPISRITREWRMALRYLALFPHEIWRLVRVLRAGGFDLVHVSGGSWQYKGVIAARLAGLPVVWHLNDTRMPGFIRRLFNLLAPLASGYVFASHRSHEYYGAGLDRKPWAIVPATVDVDSFDPSRTGSAEDELLRRFASVPVVGTVANINPIKGLETLIRAAAILHDRRIPFRLVIVGPAFASQRAYHAGLLDLARRLDVADTIVWAGGRKDVRPLLSRFDVYVCSSLAESSPVSVWEAMAMARPIVSTDVGDVARHVVDGESGFIVPVGDHEAMADRILRLLEDGEQARGFGQRARHVAVENFTPEIIASKTLDFYRRVLHPKKG